MTGYVPLKLPRLRTSTPLVDTKTGHPSREFVMFWDEHCTLIEDAINGIISLGSQISDAMGAVAELRADVEELRRIIPTLDTVALRNEIESVRRLIVPHEPIPFDRIGALEVLMPPS